MSRKILKHKKSKRMNGYAKGRLGTILGIQDRNGESLCVGDKVHYGKYTGRILYNPSYDCYQIMLDYSMWYGVDEFDCKSYGKSVDIPMDNGGKMELLLVKENI